ncbi:Asp23/Gls24 family envelope stress response protein [Lacticaseibacillus thailandensis]|nr:Asp23/Gls24 family envelope stress response protein [Lacticaseibacillus thailandensis]
MDAAKTQTNTNKVDQELKFDDAVVAKIVGITANEVTGVYSLEGGMVANMTDFFRKDSNPTKGVDVDMDDDQTVTVSLDAVLHYGENAPAIFDKLTTAIAKNVHQMTGLRVTAVKMTVKDMLTKDEIAREKDKEKAKEKDQDAKEDQGKDARPAGRPEPAPA